MGNLAEIVRGASPRPIQNPKWFDQDSKIGWLRISDVTEQNGRIHFLEQRISEAGQEKTRVLHSNHLLLSIAATVGKPVINYVATGVHDGFLIFLNPKFDLEFMFQWLEMFRPQWQKYGQPGSQVNLNSDLVKNQQISIPSLEEQGLISSFFTNLDQIITLQQSKSISRKLILKILFTIGISKNMKSFSTFDCIIPTNSWEQRKVGEIFEVTRGKVLAVTETSENKTEENIYPVYSSQTKDNGLMGYYSQYLFDTAITWTTDGANAGTVNFRNGKFYSTNVNGVLLSDSGYANKAIAEIINRLAWKHVSKVGNPKLMNNVMSEIMIAIPDVEEQVEISNFLIRFDNLITLQQCQPFFMKIILSKSIQKFFHYFSPNISKLTQKIVGATTQLIIKANFPAKFLSLF